jgi:2-polyprenyl-3-methyl-5-hydroxy-6-metoxy-1,4-benzoquinol methylase
MTSFRDQILAQVRGAANRYRVRAANGTTRSAATGGDAVAALRDTWSQYPGDWKADKRLNLGAETLGEEWGGPAFADYIVETLVAAELGPDRDVLELGCGGGKFSKRLAPRCRSLLVTDISLAMVEHAKEELASAGLSGNAEFRVLSGTDFNGVEDASLDFVFSYDVMLHLQPQNVFSYLVDARRILRDNGVFMLHQINLSSGGGLQHFLQQYSGDTWKRDFGDLRRRGHIYFMSGDQMETLAAEAGLAMDRIVSDHGEFESVTAHRDLIGFLRKRASRLERLGGVVAQEGDATVYALIDGSRYAFTAATQFERSGLEWGMVRTVSAEELAGIPDGGFLEPWE